MKYLEENYDYLPSEFVRTYDDAPLWSFYSGQLILDHLPLLAGRTYMDLGCGTGFPLLPLSERVGPGCKVYGVDVWKSALEHAKEKITQRKINNITLLNCDARDIPLPDQSVDIITSNLGINNFEKPKEVIEECRRLLQSNGSIILSTNLIGSFDQFYQYFISVLSNKGLNEEIHLLREHINQRASLEKIKNQFDSKSWQISKFVHSEYKMRFIDGTAFFNDYFIVMCFLPSWKKIVSEKQRTQIFTQLEKTMNQIAADKGGLEFTIPLLCCRINKKK